MEPGHAGWWFEQSVPMRRAEAHRLRLAASINKRGGLFQRLGDIEHAVTCYKESLALFRELGSQIGINMPLHNLGYVALQQGDDARDEIRSPLAPGKGDRSEGLRPPNLLRARHLVR